MVVGSNPTGRTNKIKALATFGFKAFFVGQPRGNPVSLFQLLPRCRLSYCRPLGEIFSQQSEATFRGKQRGAVLGAKTHLGRRASVLCVNRVDPGIDDSLFSWFGLIPHGSHLGWTAHAFAPLRPDGHALSREDARSLRYPWHLGGGKTAFVAGRPGARPGSISPRPAMEASAHGRVGRK